MTDVEEWRVIRGFEGEYEASNLGRVKSLARVIVRSNGAPKPVRERILKSSVLPKGYHQVQLRRGGRYAYIHHLVLEAFVSPRPEGMEACHINGDPGDNRVANLRWDTPSENNRDKRRHGTDHNARKLVCPRGHQLAHPNLVGVSARRGHRSCRACAQAHSYRYRHPEVDLEAEANRRYRNILKSALEVS